MQIILKKYIVFVHNSDKKLLRFVFFGAIMDLPKGKQGQKTKKEV